MTRAESEYFKWLTYQIAAPATWGHNQLYQAMYEFEFVWTLDAPHDENRCQDGKDLRTEYINTYGPHNYHSWHDRPVSVLEVLIALSRHMEWFEGGEATHHAWELIKNLRLDRMRDPLDIAQQEKIQDILNTFVWRTYRVSGKGGLFPLKNPNGDQRKVELWYQMNAYINEKQTHPRS